MKKWKEIFTEEEIIYIINFCLKKIDDFEKFKKKFPLTDTKRAEPIDSREYIKMISDIKTNSNISSYMFVELYCWCGNKKQLNKIEKSIEKKCDFEIRKRKVNFYIPKNTRHK